MLQPTDRVVAKTLVKIIGFYAALSMEPKHAAEILKIAEELVIADNEELRSAIRVVQREVIEELKAEAAGMASPNTQPYPLNADQPREPRTATGSLD